MLENVTVPALRTALPDKNIVFVFSNNSLPDFQHYFLSRHNATSTLLEHINNGENAVLGMALMDKGIAFAVETSPETIMHEYAHLHICGTWHDNNWPERYLGYLQKYPNSDRYAWCN